ncbi:MAG: tetratricopeptide repeat protein [Candidatus Krumholzibacteriota bacterium]|nr:tetratricopeptide repeat protein [Candidatus Krumholzibacteriota bacterium]
MRKRLMSIVLLALVLGGCGGPLSEKQLAALEGLPAAERVQRLEALMARHPDDARLPNLLGRARWELYEPLEPFARVEAVKSDLRADPENAVVSKLLGDSFYDLATAGQGSNYLDSALFAYENAALKAPRYLAAVGSVGALYDEKEDFEQAVAWYERALDIDPQDITTICNIGASHYNQGHYDVAVDYYRRALALDPDCQDAHYNLGVAFAEANIYREAINEWRQVVAIDSTTAVAVNAAKNADMLEDVLQETIYRQGRKSRRLRLEDSSGGRGQQGDD